MPVIEPKAEIMGRLNGGPICPITLRGIKKPFGRKEWAEVMMAEPMFYNHQSRISSQFIKPIEIACSYCWTKALGQHFCKNCGAPNE